MNFNIWVVIHLKPEILIKLRSARGKTHQEMANILGITRPAYTAYESGTRKPDYATLEKLADFFDVSVDYLLGRSENNRADPEEAFGQWVRMRAKKDDFTPEELAKLEKRVRNILKELDEELFD